MISDSSLLVCGLKTGAHSIQAVFTGVASPERARRILNRVAQGNCTGAGRRGTWLQGRPCVIECALQSVIPVSSRSAAVCHPIRHRMCHAGTWVSERPYYIHTARHPSQLMADSTSAEARVALMDAKARIAAGDVECVR